MKLRCSLSGLGDCGHFSVDVPVVWPLLSFHGLCGSADLRMSRP
jgi:hypothetical protein